MQVTIDKDGCIACGLCVNNCPDVFRFGGDGKAEPFGDPAGYEHDVADAAASCPVNVIRVD